MPGKGHETHREEAGHDDLVAPFFVVFLIENLAGK
jgi:hypothetical protein